jgi:glyoxylase I family protein
MTSTPIIKPVTIHHIRLTVTDIHRSKAFYQQLLGTEIAFDFSDQVDEPGVREDRAKMYGGTGFAVGDQLLGLRPVASPDDTFSSTRVGLDHLSLQVASEDELRAAVARLDEAGIEHGEITPLEDAGMVILSLQDPDDINVELVVVL